MQYIKICYILYRGKIRTMLVQITWISLVLLVGSVVINGNPEPMARPMRPKVFSNPEELRRYLDLVRDYYTLNGKPRYRHWKNLLKWFNLQKYTLFNIKSSIILKNQWQFYHKYYNKKMALKITSLIILIIFWLEVFKLFYLDFIKIEIS